MNFIENSRYLLEQSIFNREEGVGFRRILTCHCVQDGWAYLSDTSSLQVYTEKVEYKYNIKRERMYVYNRAFSSWDSVQEFTVTEYGSPVVSSTNTSYDSYKVI